jgi:hypothetical protein
MAFSATWPMGAPSMFKVLRLKDDSFVLMAGKQAVYGDIWRMVKVMTALGVDYMEIEDGLTSLRLNDHDLAEYGLNKTFMYSKRLYS